MEQYNEDRRFTFNALSLGVVGFISALVLLFIFNLPEKYRMTLTLVLIATPLIFLVKNKEKLLIGAFLVSLPIGMGYMLIQRLESTNLAVQFTFQLYLCDIFLILLVFIWLFKALLGKYRNKHSIWHSKLIIPLVLWMSMGIVSLIPAIDRTATAIEIVRMGRILLTFFCVFYYVKGRKEINFVLNCLLIALFFQALLMFAQYATNSLVIRFPGDVMGLDIVEQGLRPSGTMFHSSHFAKFSGMILPIALAYIFFSPRLIDKLFMISIWVCGSVALVMTISRAGLVAWLLSMILFLMGVIFIRKVPIRRMVPLFMISMLGICISAGVIYSVGGERLKSRVVYDAGSSAARIPMWEVALNVIKENPLIGVGLKNYTLVHQDYDNTYEHISVLLPDSPVHNLFLLYAAEIGIPGLFFFLWFIWRLVKGALWCTHHLELSMDKAIYLGMDIGVIALFLQSTTGMGVTNHLIHLSVISIFAACVAKQCLLLGERKLKILNIIEKNKL